MASSVNPSALCQSVTFTATVTAASPGGGTPTGTVTFKQGGTALGTGTLSGGTAIYSTSSLAQGSDSITATIIKPMPVITPLLWPLTGVSFPMRVTSSQRVEY